MSSRSILCLGAAGLLITAEASQGQLSPGALEQIAALEQEKASFTPAQRKLDSQLVFALKQSRGELIAEGRVPHLRIGTQADKEGLVEVDIAGESPPDLLQQVQNHGGVVAGNQPLASPVRARIPLARVEEIAALPAIRFIRPAIHPTLNHTDPEGVATHQDNLARSAYYVDGSNVKVAVMSGGVAYLAQAQTNGNLGPVTVLPGQAGPTNNGEGTAMLEIVQAMAPGAQLFYATGDPTETQFATNILNLRFTYGCDIIVDDVTYADESPFQDGVVAQAVDAVVADGCLYFSSAANSGNLDSTNSGTWEGDFVGGSAVAFPTNGLIHSFGAATYNTITGTNSEQGLTTLFWSDPIGASTNDYDLFVLDSSGTNVVSSSVNWQWGTQDPIELVPPPALGERLIVVLASGTSRFLHIDTSRAQLAIGTSGNTRGHNAATNAFTVAAVDVATAYPGPFTGGAANPVEPFSSDGPRRMFYFPDGTPMTPGNYSSTGGILFQKPDVTAANGVTTDLPVSTGLNPFFGTSAAAPHAAAIAALLKSYNPALTPAEIRTLLTSTALDIMAPGVDRDSGWGIVMPAPALQIAPAPPPTILTVSPAGAAVGQSVSIYGASFRTASNVSFAGVSASYSISSNSFIQTTVPAGANSGSLTVATPYGAASVPFVVLPTLPPPNDNFVNAQVVTGMVFMVSGNNVGATKEPGEPNHAGNSGGASVWYRWTAPSSGNFTLDTIGSDFQTLLAVYTGNSVSSLTAVASNIGSGGNGTSLLTFGATGGTTYQIAADGFNGATGDIVLRLEPATITVYSTSFEPSEGFALGTLAGQNGWTTNSGTGANGIVTNFFAGYGQQAYLGYYSPTPAVNTAVYRPLSYAVDTNNRPLVQFSTTMAIADSNNGNYDYFWWLVSNATNHLMFGILFDNNIKFIDYVLDTGGENAGLPLYDSGNSVQATPNTLAVAMDFGRGKWSATWNGAPLTIYEQPLTTTGAALTLGSIDAFWQFGNSSFPGNNYMLFDNYSVTAGPSDVPRILLGPQDATVEAGSDVFLNVAAAGAAPLAYQWSYTNGVINGATNDNLILRNVVSGQSGTYSVLVSDANGTASAAAVVTITNPPPQAQFVVPAFSGTNGLLLQLSLAIGNNYRLQTSTNLLDWSTIAAFYAAGTNTLCFDSATSGFKEKFYRLDSP